MKKLHSKFVGAILTLSIAFSTVIPAFAADTVDASHVETNNTVNFDFDSIDYETLIKNGETLTVDLGSDMQLVVGGQIRQSRLFSYKWVDLSGPNTYNYILSDSPLLKTNLQINNYDINPGKINVLITTSDGVAHYIYNVPLGGYAYLNGIPKGTYTVHIMGQYKGSYEFCLFDFGTNNP